MRPSKVKRDRLARQNRDLKYFFAVVTPPEAPTDPNLQAEIESRIASGHVTLCPPSRRRNPPKRFRYDINP
jgi:hypothetical protein